MDKARSRLETELAEHANAMLQIKHRINSLAPVGCLPPELLCKIFLLHASSHYATRDQLVGAYPSFEPYQWITFTHVCQYWRTAALAMPFLWSTIFLDSVDWVKEMLVRSKGVPLTVWSTDSCLPLDAFKLVMAELPRIRSFHIESRSLPRELEDSMSTLLARTYVKSAPQMEELAFRSAMCWERYPAYSNNPCDYRFDTSFRGCQLPNLRRLEIKAYDKQWTSALLRPTLTHLKLSSKHILHAPHIRQTLSALASMPLLEELDLAKVFSGYPSLLDINSRHFHLDPAHLPALRTLRLSHNAIACSLLIRHITAPSLSSIMLDCSLYARPTSPAPSPTVQLRELRTTLEDKVATFAPAGPYSLSMQLPFVNSTGVLEFQLWGHHLPAPRLLTDDAPFADVRMTFDREADSSVLGFCSPAWLARTTSCHVNLVDYDGQMGSNLVNLLRHAPGLTELSVGQWTRDYLCATLAPQSREDEGVPVPKLATLLLRDMSVRPMQEPGVGFINGLRTALQSRADAGAKVQTLVLHECQDVTAADVDVLRAVVGDVQWDGVVRSSIGQSPVRISPFSDNDY